jgi:transcriptional regulator with GAF, ATPase, and Fis domain
LSTGNIKAIDMSESQYIFSEDTKMETEPFALFKSFSEELDPDELQRKFLHAVLRLQNVERGSIWIKKNNKYLCIEAAGRQCENILGAEIDEDQQSVVGWVIENGRMTISNPNKDPRHYKEFEENLSVKSRLILCFPLFLRNNNVYGAVQLIDTSPENDRINLDSSYLGHIQDLVNIGSLALSNAILFSKQQEETQALKSTLEEIRNSEILVGQSPSFHSCMEMIRSYARTEYPVLITGESGTGKELISREIHRLSTRRDKPLLVQNCSTIPENLLESELFGYKKGAFTGAVKDKVGLFEAAEGGTVFLDEIGDMPLNLQARILRVIQNSEIKPLGETSVKKIDIRIISATNKRIKNLVDIGEFREDLFYRLSVLPLHLPPLRERQEDIPLLMNHFMNREAIKTNIQVKIRTTETMRFLMAYHWPGNIRELENLVRYLLVTTENDCIIPQDLPIQFTTKWHPPVVKKMLPPVENDSSHANQPNILTDGMDFDNVSWDEVEKKYALYLLQKHHWNVTWAARDAGLNRSTFASRMKRLGIRKPVCHQGMHLSAVGE